MRRRQFTLIFGLVLISIIFGTFYVSLQQVLRQGANKIPSQVAEQAKIDLSNGKAISDIVPQTKNELIDSFSITPFIIAYDSSNNVIASSITVGGQQPDLPAGVLLAAKEAQPGLDNENRVTWQPALGTREAIVVVSTQDGSESKVAHIVAGQSLRETEKQIDYLGKIILAGWLLSSLAWLGYWLSVRKA